MRWDELLRLLDEDRELIAELVAAGILPRDEAAELSAERVADACVARTLVRELDVNWPGVEIILRLRAELIETHRQVADLVRLLHNRR